MTILMLFKQFKTFLRPKALFLSKNKSKYIFSKSEFSSLVVGVSEATIDRALFLFVKLGTLKEVSYFSVSKVEEKKIHPKICFSKNIKT